MRMFSSKCRFQLVAGLLAATVAFAADASGQDLNALIEAGHFKRAKPLIDSRLQKNPKDAEALYASAIIKEKSNDLDGAIALAEQAVAADPNKAQYHAQLGEMYGNKAGKVSMFSAMKFAHKIRDEGEKALQLDPKLSDAHELLIQYYLQAPGIAGGDKNKAYQMLDKLFTIDACRANSIRAELAAKDKREAEAENYYKNAVAANPNDYEAQSNLANWYLAKKKFDLAEKASRELLRIDRGRSYGYLALAVLYANTERWPDLDAALADAEKNVPDNFGYYYQAGRSLLGTGKDLPRAEKYLKKYMTQEPEIGSATLAHAHWRLGLVYEKEGRKPEAVQELQTAVNLKPDLEDAKKDLKRLK
jgi:tetratricopeptide (TPR) repeat protein